MSGDFYRAFEEKYRGSRELIKSRLSVYLPFVEPLFSIYKGGKGIDLGCGRGEWLELLQSMGFDATGVDLDDGMLAACRERGLNVVTKDAVAALKALPDASQVLVSGFHIAEHLPFSHLQLLVQEALRVLEPAGLLILETPNPENITVGTANFYLDPTHQRPIPPPLLSFLAEHYGYAKVKVVRLQEDKSLVGKAQTTLSDVLGGVSPDYAVVAQKYANDALLSCNNVAFEHEYGVTLDDLAGKFDQQVQQASARTVIAETETRIAQAEARTQQASARAAIAEAETRIAQAEARTQQASARAAIAEAETRIAQAEARTQQAIARADELDAGLEKTREELHNVHQSNHHHWQLATERHKKIEALQTSWSWRLTAPLRWVAQVAFRLRLRTKAVQTVQRRSLINRLIFWAMAKPALVSRVHQLLARYPKLRQMITRRVELAMHSSALDVPRGPVGIGQLEANHSIGLEHLSPHARRIYADLKLAVAKRQEGGV